MWIYVDDVWCIPVKFFCFDLQRIPRKSKKKKPAAEAAAADDEALAEAAVKTQGDITPSLRHEFHHALCLENVWNPRHWYVILWDLWDLSGL